MLNRPLKETIVQMNVGIADRAARVVVGVGLISAAFASASPAWAWIGIVPLVTGVAGLCPIYGILGINTGRLHRN